MYPFSYSADTLVVPSTWNPHRSGPIYGIVLGLLEFMSLRRRPICLSSSAVRTFLYGQTSGSQSREKERQLIDGLTRAQSHSNQHLRIQCCYQ